jgi:hypothetical protein
VSRHVNILIVVVVIAVVVNMFVAHGFPVPVMMMCPNIMVA